MRSTALFRACLLLMLLLPTQTLAHPHAWIDLQVTVLFDQQGRATALKQSWDLDSMYSLVVHEQIRMEAEGEDEEAKFENFGRQMVDQAAEFGYMTELERNGRRVAVDPVTDFSLALVDGRLRLSFVLPFAEPLSLESAPLRYAVFDPTFYIEITHADERGLLLSQAPPNCSFVITPPEPNDAMRARAMMIDAMEMPDPELGRHFAEQTEIRCNASN